MNVRQGRKATESGTEGRHMFRTRTRRLVAPALVATALVLAGCSGTATTGTSTPVDTDADPDTTEVESVDLLADNLHNVDDAVNAALADLSARLDEVTPGLAGVALSTYVDSVDVNVVVEDENITPVVPADDLRAILDELAAFESPGDPVTEWVFNAWDLNGWSVDILETAKELGLDASVIDEEWNRLTIPADLLGSS
jgi:hypothetical protein